MGKAWTFDDDDEPGMSALQYSDGGTAAAAAAGPYGGAGSGLRTVKRKRARRQWKWPWAKEKVLGGERVVPLNGESAGAPGQDEFCSNYVSTSKYNVVTFVPKFFAEQFSKYANLFFLFTACIQQIPGVSPTNRYTTIAPLSVVLLASAFKEVGEDLKRHQSDAELNTRKTKVLQPGASFADESWENVQVGDIVRLESDDFIPADLVLISSSEPEGLCYIETSNLDGETNLKIKQASPQTSSLTAPHLVVSTRYHYILTFIILYNNLIPISLIVTMEVVKFQQAQLINSDLDMYYAKTDTPALCRTSSLVEELGQIEYVFSDKTGTLTRNEMEFRCCSIAGVPYADEVEEGKEGWKSFAELRGLAEGSSNPFVDAPRGEEGREREVVNEFLSLLAVCHTVIPEVKNEKIVYQASSPDEAALVAGAELLGYQFHTRKPKSVFVNMHGSSREFEILNVCEFNSTRKRMSTVVRGPDGKIKLYCKGADTVILERLSKDQPYTEKTLQHLEDYATEGLRTLCIAYRDISDAEYRQWAAMYDQAAATINGRGDALDKAAEAIEKDMFLLGATAIEDKLQEGVPDTIHTLQMAGIKVWVLTGDRQETAINIGMSCRLISESMNMVIVNEETAQATEEFIMKRLTAIKNQRSAGETEDLALIIDGKSLTFALEKPLNKSFLELAIMCKAVVCCRVSPLQKALVVKLVKKNQKSILLAIGDGANDVSMIQAAHVGVGISGLEGLQAARSSDVAISQFRYLKKLLLVHGAWSYTRLSKLILYSFYKNIVLYMTQFWFSFFNNFSGQIAYESWTLSLYNVLFTVLPPLVIGIFDQFVSARILDRYPQLYTLGQKNTFFTRTAFWQWVANALWHSLILFAFSVILWWGDLKQSSGLDTGHWFWGTTLYLAVLLTVLGKAALISDLWTKYTVAAIPGSFAFTMAFLPLYATVAPAIGFSTEYEGIVSRLWTDGVFYFVLLLVPIVCLARDFVWKYYRRTYSPLSYHIAQELQKYNIPDYRPRQEQFQKAIKKVRAVQRMRRNRGFAFSQTEDVGRQDQARLIRAYDTSKSYARPSGY
ncbi:aminophospholipid-transporting P-type ATPase [Punctularia strigosozonata HHB-11173 SS5]|uniref:aminophospholipid-transporting P-type ATPase n=1 Tax=Punctularia strigosozonata (strain HHB-11173) TaxID=741275 RepID=UPI0004416C6A|nr:aminophospholipid-transporting P-type ATPase [Punctularia strigosozonata HHB-11173 SS5]EIN08690.1 aminophospholipid-transporting P-type ATPase [Punctularia strigosozonata HHB-11173 SS5]